MKQHASFFTFVVVLCLFLSHSVLYAQFGRVMPSEQQEVVDNVTNARFTLLTDTTRNDRFLYQTDPMWTSDGQYLLFRSSSRSEEPEQEYTARNGEKRRYRPTQYYFIHMATGRIIQATEGSQGASVYLANHSMRMFISRRIEGEWKMFVMDLERFFTDVWAGQVKPSATYEQYIGTFPATMGRPGSYAVSADDKWAYIGVERDGTPEEIERMKAKAFRPKDNQPIKIQPVLSGLRRMNLLTGEVTHLIDTDFKIGHIQTSRFRPEEIVFCNETGGDAHQRMWYCNADSAQYRPLYQETPLDWVTHETFASEDYVYFNILGFQPRLRRQASGILRINLRTDDVELLGQVEMQTDGESLNGRGFWHCNASSDDRWSVGDTFAGSVWIIDNEHGTRHHIAAHTRMKPDHAHPKFSPDGKYLIFQSGHYTQGKRLNLVLVDLTQFDWFNATK